MKLDRRKNQAYRCPVEYTLDLIGGKWKVLILWALVEDEVKRYGELRQALAGITDKILSQALRELESQDLVSRHQYEEIPPRVEYELTAKGRTLIPILREMCSWGQAHMD